MNYICGVLLIQTIWMTNITALYHELSMEEFSPIASLHKNAMFGYSVTYVPSDKTLIVSAPKANAIGEVYTCDLRTRNYCTKISHDIHSDDPTYNYWLGATVKAGSDFFATCAPRFPKIPTTSSGTLLKYGTYSLCFYSHNGTLKRMESLSDDKKEKNDLYERYMDSFGWSIDINDENNILVGSPAADKGRVIQYKDRSPGKAPVYISAVNKNVNYNFGYSVTYCKFNFHQEIAIGSPYGKIGYGAVYFSSRDKPVIDSNGNDIPVGSLFAASLCYANHKGRGPSILLVGAPTFARNGQYNRGAVFIYISSQRSAFKESSMALQARVCGEKDGGYFGSAIAKLGDLNGDNREDIAISAPYEDDGRGAVYIYSGAELIKNKAEKQIPYLQRIQHEKYRSFGLSLSAIADYDNNGCNELAIGAPGDNSAVVLRCMAAITLTVVDLYENHNTEIAVPGSFEFVSTVIIQYPRLPTDIDTEISIEIVLMHIHAKFKDTTSKNSYIIKIKPGRKEKQFSHNITILTPPNTSYDPMLQYHITATLLKDPRSKTYFDPSLVLLSNASVLSKPGKVWIGDCKIEKKCTPKLELEVITSLRSQYVVGSSNVETLNIIARNTGDTAYSAVAKINLTGVLASKWPQSCTRDSDEELTCKYQALLRKNTSWETGNIELETKSLASDATNPATKINITVNLYDEFTKAKVEQWNQTVTLISNSENVTVKGMTKLGDIVNVTVEEATTTGAHIDHVYSIINYGMTTWKNVHATITLRKDVFLSNGVNELRGDNYVCSESLNNDTENKIVCAINRIEKVNKFDVVISIELLPGDLEGILRKGNATVFSTLQFELNGDMKKHSITSTLRLYEVMVPTWIIIAAALVGLLLLIILAFAMYECGFLRRKNKERLNRLKKDVKRQTIRRSMMLQHGSRGGNEDDLTELINKSDNDEESKNANSLTTEAEIVPQETTRKKPDVQPKPKLKTVPENECDDKEIEKNDTKKDTQPTDVETKKNPRMELIIGGLQKNVRDQQLEGSTNKNN